MTELTGSVLRGRYRVDEFIGRGGMADVYRVWDSQRMVHLAMKVLREDLAEDRTFLRRFQREASVLQSLDHPNIVRFYGIEQVKEQLLAFMLMDYVDGTTLRATIFQKEQPLSPVQVWRFTKPVLAALNYAHSKGIFHCDIKPGNVMIDHAGRVLLADFGIARLAESATVTFSTPGTPAYMAPEQCRGSEDLDARTDIYALGVALFEMLTGGERPFSGDTAGTRGSRGERTRWQHLHETPPSPMQYNGELSGPLEQIVLRCLEKDPEMRYQSAPELLEALEAAIQPTDDDAAGAWRTAPTPLSESIEASKPALPPMAARLPATRLPWVLGAIALVIVVVSAIFLVGSTDLAVDVDQTAAVPMQTDTSSALQVLATTTATPTTTATLTSTATATETATQTLSATSTPTETALPAGYAVLPDVAGLSGDDAVGTLTASGFEAFYQPLTNLTATPNTIFAMTPEAGAIVQQHSTPIKMFLAVNDATGFVGGGRGNSITFKECRGTDGTIRFGQAPLQSIHAWSTVTYTVPPGDYALRIDWVDPGVPDVDTIWTVGRGAQVVAFGDQCR